MEKMAISSFLEQGHIYFRKRSKGDGFHEEAHVVIIGRTLRFDKLEKDFLIILYV